MTRDWDFRRPLALVLAAAALSVGAAAAQPMSPAERMEQCHACHGADGNSKIENVPSIAGQPALFVLTQLVLMREGVRPVEAMKDAVRGVKDEEFEAIARHFARLAAARSDEAVDPALARRGAALSEQRRCGSCHLPDFSGQNQIPRIARQRVDYLIKSLKEFRDGTRAGGDTIMSGAVAGISDADLAALAHFAASK